MSNKDSKIVVNRPCAEVKKLTKTHDMKETINLVEIHPVTNKAKYKYEAEGDPLPPVVPPPPGPEDDGEAFNKEWVLKQIKLTVGDAVTILRDEGLQREKRIDQKFEESKSERQQTDKRIDQKFEQTNKRLDRVEKQNKDINEKLEAILELLKKKDK
ncbi:hypothetical protein [Mycoplasmopsis agassizii]|uniref:Uncharacterized protein n=1 Tax=Mycoplasmopsis agassizii TaxID=33922 RepID=A0ABX4H4X6_9BACT|nr:hypothetical protein [Mycoplasmopsis agassizii]PAF54867.1 hypothetical protein CJF60_03980 [Mycoplasmopsis agassizii]SMC20826.1 hypothetical protein SAMN02745179_01046 [Mycoplasmopsis agassizii]